MSTTLQAHTVVFAVLASVVGGALVAWLLAGPIGDWIDDERFDRKSLVVFSTGTFLTGSLSHLVADVLSAPDISTPIEPFWPLFDKPWSVDLIRYNAFRVDFGFVAVMIPVHLLLAYVDDPGDHRYRMSASKYSGADPAPSSAVDTRRLSPSTPAVFRRRHPPSFAVDDRPVATGGHRVSSPEPVVRRPASRARSLQAELCYEIPTKADHDEFRRVALEGKPPDRERDGRPGPVRHVRLRPGVV